MRRRTSFERYVTTFRRLVAPIITFLGIETAIWVKYGPVWAIGLFVAICVVVGALSE